MVFLPSSTSAGCSGASFRLLSSEANLANTLLLSSLCDSTVFNTFAARIKCFSVYFAWFFLSKDPAICRIWQWRWHREHQSLSVLSREERPLAFWAKAKSLSCFSINARSRPCTGRGRCWGRDCFSTGKTTVPSCRSRWESRVNGETDKQQLDFRGSPSEVSKTCCEAGRPRMAARRSFRSSVLPSPHRVSDVTETSWTSPESTH